MNLCSIIWIFPSFRLRDPGVSVRVLSRVSFCITVRLFYRDFDFKFSSGCCRIRLDSDVCNLYQVRQPPSYSSVASTVIVISSPTPTGFGAISMLITTGASGSYVTSLVTVVTFPAKLVAVIKITFSPGDNDTCLLNCPVPSSVTAPDPCFPL